MAMLCLHCPSFRLAQCYTKGPMPMVLLAGKETQGGHPAPSVLQAFPRNLTWVSLHKDHWGNFLD